MKSTSGKDTGQSPAHGPDAEISFGPYRFDRDRRILWEGDNLLHVGERALAILGALTEVPGRLVAKRELLERAWPDGRVDDANLKVQISTLRKALRRCEGLIRAESSLGYRFLGEAVADPYLNAQRRCAATPPLLTEPIGRDDVVAEIVSLLKDSRMVTVLGPGGIGKTTVALAIAHLVADTFADETCFIDLSRITRDDEICEAVARALDSPVEEAPPALEQIQAALQGRRLLLVIDSCEHVADAIALLVEQVLSVSNQVWILATSRESLRVAAEFVWQLEPLEVPPLSLIHNAANAARYPAVQLFLRTAAEVSDDFMLDDDIAPTVVEICRRLDGIPRAIETTASMVTALDVGEIRRSLDQRLSLLELNREEVDPLHDSLFSNLRWRCDLLPFNERAVLRRLACFDGAFTLDAAVSVFANDVTDASFVREAVVALANKSFLIVDHQINPPEYRLLETMRVYAARHGGEGKHAMERCEGC